ncbi:hypothetical protein J6590_031026 [Homalodisca vitripennis]|nr:hypothetical protein J6590_031026 [Homalodisca vitripennis]
MCHLRLDNPINFQEKHITNLKVLASLNVSGYWPLLSMTGTTLVSPSCKVLFTFKVCTPGVVMRQVQSLATKNPNHLLMGITSAYNIRDTIDPCLISSAKTILMAQHAH